MVCTIADILLVPSLKYYVVHYIGQRASKASSVHVLYILSCTIYPLMYYISSHVLYILSCTIYPLMYYISAQSFPESFLTWAVTAIVLSLFRLGTSDIIAAGETQFRA